MDHVTMYTCICPLAWNNKYKPLQFIDTSLVISHLLVHQSKEREAMKDKTTHYVTMDKS